VSRDFSARLVRSFTLKPFHGIAESRKINGHFDVILLGLCSVLRMKERIILHFVECVQHIEFYYVSSSAAAYCIDKNIHSIHFLKTVKRDARHVDGEAVLRWVWYVARGRYRNVYERLVGICGGYVLWMVDYILVHVDLIL
jgi:hypothetical protein